MTNAHILILGCGYVGQHLLLTMAQQKAYLMPVSRDVKRVEQWREEGYDAVHMPSTPDALPAEMLKKVTVIIDAIPLLRRDGMQAGQTEWLTQLLAQCPNLQYAVYLSSTSVYGQADGQWVSEDWPCQPQSERGRQRLIAEQHWTEQGIPLAIFRLAGIYGPGRNLQERLRSSAYCAVRWQPEHYSNRIHVDDIVRCLRTAIAQHIEGVFNISDDLPLPHADYVSQLAAIIDAPPPEIITPQEAKGRLSEAVLSFFQDNKRIDNQRMHQYLCEKLHYPSFRHYFEHQ